MSAPMYKGIGRILDTLCWNMDWHDKEDDMDSAEQEIKRLLRSTLPKKLPIDSNEFSPAFIRGFNRAITEMEEDIKEILE